MSRRQPAQRLDPLIEGYLAYLADVGRRSRRTVIDTRCTLKHVSAVLAERTGDRPLWKLELTDYLWWLDQARQSAVKTSNLKKQISHLRGFLDYAWRSGRAGRNVLDGFQLQEGGAAQEPAALTIAEAERLVRSCPAQSAVERRDRMVVLLLLYGCGLRTHELCALQVHDVDVPQRELKVHVAKGDRERIVPLPQVVHTELLAYLQERGGRRGPLFRTAVKGRRLSARDVCGIVRAAAERAGLALRVTPMTLRHSYATHLMDRGVDLAVIGETCSTSRRRSASDANRSGSNPWISEARSPENGGRRSLRIAAHGSSIVSLS